MERFCCLGGSSLEINSYLIRFAVTIIVIFGGIFTIRYFKTGELLLDQIIGALIGVILLIGAYIWRNIRKKMDQSK